MRTLSLLSAESESGTSEEYYSIVNPEFSTQIVVPDNIKNSINKIELIFNGDSGNGRLVINNYEIFCENYSKIGELLTTLYRDGPKYGISFIM